MRLEDMNYEQLVSWAAGYVLQRLIAGELRTGVDLVMQQTLRWNKHQREKEELMVKAKRVVPKHKDGSPGKYEGVLESELSNRAKHALIQSGMTDAFQVRTHVRCQLKVLKEKGHTEYRARNVLMGLSNIGGRTADEIVAYYRIEK